MRPAPLLMLSALAACAGPDAHRIPARQTALSPDTAPAPRATVAEVLAHEDPLAADTGVGPVDGGAAPHHHAHDAEGVDPVCGMKVDPKTARGGSVTVGGTTHHFCSASCREHFLKQQGGTP